MCKISNCNQCNIIKVTQLDPNADEFIPSRFLFKLDLNELNGNDRNEFAGFDLNLFTLYFVKPKGKKLNTRFINFRKRERQRLATYNPNHNLIFNNLCKVNNLPLQKVSDFIPDSLPKTKSDNLSSIQPFTTFTLSLKKKRKT